MNIYIVPVVDGDGPYIDSIKANSLKDAESKLVTTFIERYDLDYCTDLNDLKEAIKDTDIQVGSFYDLEEF